MLVLATLLLLYVKVLEENELEDRFGADYLEYKQTTPFLIPRIPKKPRGRSTAARAGGGIAG